MFSANSSQVSEDRLYVEDVFSTWLYTGNGSTQTITNGIDLAGKGGLLWIKSRTSDTAPDHYLNFNDGSNIVSNQSNNTSARQVMSPYVAFNSNGFYVNAAPGFLNNNGVNYTSWTFRKAPKFFDVVTYTGDGNSSTDTPSPFGRGIPHSLGIKPGFVVIKRTDASGDWWVAAQKSGSTQWFAGSSSELFALNRTNAAAFTLNGTSQVYATETAFYPAWIAGGGGSALNINGATYVAYLFAHDTTSDGIIQCGSYTGNGSATGPSVTLGWEPQWVLVKNVTTAGYDWWMLDTMRGFTAPSANDAYLAPNLSQAEVSSQDIMSPTATGFQLSTSGPMFNRSGDTFIYIAIRRGPMRTPTSGTSVFSPLAVNNSNGTINTIGFPYDMQMVRIRSDGPAYFFDRLRGVNSTTSAAVTTPYLQSTTTGAEATLADFTRAVSNTGFTTTSQLAGVSNIYWNFRRAPSFFDEVCYTGTGSALTLNHNLSVAPELIIVKKRSGAVAAGWPAAALFTSSGYREGALNGAFALDPADYVSYSFSAQPTATTFSVAGGNATSASGSTYVAYLFASCPGVSKVGSYTGNGSSQTINCGFAAGARFVMIKRTDSGGDWYVWDSARGIVAGNDPRLSLNNTNAEVTTDDSVDTDSSGFVVNQLSATNINVNAATYLYMAVA